MDSIYIQPIFAPDKMRFERNMASLESFFSYMESNIYDLKYAIGGWVSSEDFWYL